MTRVFLSFILCLLTLPSIAGAAPVMSLAKVNKSIVKIFAVRRSPSYSLPWQFRGQSVIVGSGVIIEGGRIMTNAHVVSDSVFLQVKKPNDPKKYIAYVEQIGHQCDLAILKTKDKGFFTNTQPLALDGLPTLQDTVSVYGFPTGGAEISITQGIVSRIEQLTYSHSGLKLLGIQIDAAINPGNSGGPALVGDKVIGIAMQVLRAGDNIGYIIPTPVIHHFLDDIADGRYDGFPDSGIIIQRLENRFLREYYGLKEDQTGVAVIRVIGEGSAGEALKKGDVIVTIDGEIIANDGTVKMSDTLRVSASYIVQKHFIGEPLTLGVIRDRKLLNIKITLKESIEMAPLRHDEKPSYFIYGGLVFMPLTNNYLREWGRNWYSKAPMTLLYNANSTFPTKDKKQIIFLQTVLAHETNVGYHTFRNLIVEKVNGVAVRDMKDLLTAIELSRGGSTVVEMDRGLHIVLDDKISREAQAQILERYGIKSAVSDDLAHKD